ncbi:MAG: hypothetical protein JXR77_19680 [Lentisphaeria bacterium]|nr:hypothetical protein [Lentisphaeria bacterium]
MISLETATFQWGIDGCGRNVCFRDSARGADLLAQPGSPVAAVRRRGETFHPTRASLRGRTLRLTFEDGTLLCLDVEASRNGLVLSVAEVEAAAYDRLDFLDIPLTPCSRADAEAFCACAVSRNLRARVDAVPGPQERLTAACYPRFGSIGASVAVVAQRFCELRAALQAVVAAAPDLPHSPLGGPWALDAPDRGGSYLFGVASEETVDDWIGLCRDFGVGQLHFCGGGAFRLGDYDPGPGVFPRGIDSVRAVVDRLHGAGLKAGLHTLSFSIAKNSRYVTPVADPRLGCDHHFTLAADLDTAADIVPVLEPTGHMPLHANYSTRHSMTLRIDQELIDYRGVRGEPPHALTDCVRGAYGTRPAPHRAGSPVGHLKACWGMFAPGGDSSLFTEIAANIATLIDTAGFDMVYLDGLDGAHILGNGDEGRWHYGGRFAFEVFRRLERPIIMEMAAFLHHLWFLRSRMGAWDHPSRGHRHFIDLHCRSNANFGPIFLPGHLGWWAPRVSTGPKDETTFADDAAYLCVKALAHDIGFSLQGLSPQGVRATPHLRALGEVFRRHEAVRRQGVLSPALRAELGLPGAEFELVDGAGERPVFHRLHRHTWHTALPGQGGPAWSVQGKFPVQAPDLRLEALWSVADYDAPGGVTLAAFLDPAEFADNGPVRETLNSGEDFEYADAAPGMSGELAPVPGGGPEGGAAAAFRAHRARDGGHVPSSAPDDTFSVLHHGERFHRPRPASWFRRGKGFDPCLDLRQAQALGLWVHGDAGGEWLNLQLRSRGNYNTYSDSYIPVDFHGWRYVELVEPESDRYDILSWPYARAVYKLHRHGTEYDSVRALHLWLNGIAEDGAAEVLLSPIRALPIVPNRLRDPALTINGRTVVFPVTLESGWRVEINGNTGTVFTREGHTRETFPLTTPLPPLGPGPNTVSFACDSEHPRPRARITLVTREPRPLG